MKSEATSKEYTGLLKASSSRNFPFLFIGVGRIVTAAIPSKKRLKKPQMRCPQAKPIFDFGRRFVMITGYIIPPIGEPVEAKDIAIARFLKN